MIIGRITSVLILVFIAKYSKGDYNEKEKYSVHYRFFGKNK